MKLGLLLLVISISTMGHSKTLSCWSTAKKAALSKAERTIRADEGDNVEDYILPRAPYRPSNIDNKSEIENGIFVVEMGVYGNCYETMKVKTRVINKDGRQECKVISIKVLEERECG